MTVENKVRRIVSQQLYVHEDEVTEDKKLSDDLDADSLDLLELVNALEEEFGRDLSPEYFDGVVTVGDLYKATKTALGV